MTNNSAGSGHNHGSTRRWGRAQQDRQKNPYRAAAKPAEPTVCPQCGAVFSRGRWQWAKTAPDGARQLRCEACRRIAENYPAGIATFEGTTVATHSDEIQRLMRHQEEAEKSEHPLNRIMSIERPSPASIIVHTTDIHLPRRLARAVEKAYGGRATEHFERDGAFVRIAWREA